MGFLSQTQMVAETGLGVVRMKKVLAPVAEGAGDLKRPGFRRSTQ